jgi:hypothetical protein
LDLSKQSTNEFFAIHLFTNEIIARVNHEGDSRGPAPIEANLP